MEAQFIFQGLSRMSAIYKGQSFGFVGANLKDNRVHMVHKQSYLLWYNAILKLKIYWFKLKI